MIANLNVRLLSDGSVYYTYEFGGKYVTGSSRDWPEFASLLLDLVQR